MVYARSQELLHSKESATSILTKWDAVGLHPLLRPEILGGSPLAMPLGMDLRSAAPLSVEPGAAEVQPDAGERSSPDLAI